MTHPEPDQNDLPPALRATVQYDGQTVRPAGNGHTDQPVRLPNTPEGPAASDVANAQTFLNNHGHRFRYHAERKRWLVYRHGVWTEDHDQVQAREAAEQTARNLLRKAADDPDPDRAKKTAKRARAAMSSRKLSAALTVAEPHIAVYTDQLDADPWLLNATNGTVDLHDGTLAEHDPHQMLTRQTNAAYRPDARADTWQRFLTEILPDPQVRAFLQRLTGASLIGRQHEHILPIFHGSGSNGKTTYVEALVHALGTYAVKIDVNVLVGRNHRSGAAPEIVKLRGVRLAVADEPDAGARLREAHVKALTGGDTITARGLYQDPIEFSPSHTLALATNHRPEVRGSDEGIWRRLMLVPFQIHIPRPKRDKTLGDKLAAEADGILTWAIQGALHYQTQGLSPPDPIDEATAAYRAEEDHLSAFIDETCLTNASSGLRVQPGQLYDAYTGWCSRVGIQPMTGTAFGRELTDRGYPQAKSSGRRWRTGIALKARHDDEDHHDDTDPELPV